MYNVQYTHTARISFRIKYDINNYLEAIAIVRKLRKTKNKEERRRMRRRSGATRMNKKNRIVLSDVCNHKK